jgi:hypothetical protein
MQNDLNGIGGQETCVVMAWVNAHTNIPIIILVL